MQFLVYLTILMISISTVLLEVHWLTSPAPQPKPAVQVANVTTAPRKVEGPTQIEGPSPALSPVYPKPEDATPAVDASAAQPQPQQSTPQQAQAPSNPAPARAVATANPEPPKATAETTTAEPQKPTAETTGVAARSEENRQAATVTPVQATASNNRCDVQACSSAYQSFRASDCTYQPFEGPRQICSKAPAQQRTARDQSERPERRQWSREYSSRDSDRTVGRRVYDEDSDEVYADDDDGPPRFSLFGFGGRRRW
jgi:hypothetical protein